MKEEDDSALKFQQQKKEVKVKENQMLLGKSFKI